MRTGVNDATTAVHVVQAKEDLFGDLAYQVLWDALALVTLDETKEVLAEDLKHHADVCSVGTSVAKVVEEGDDMRSAGMGLGRGGSGVWV